MPPNQVQPGRDSISYCVKSPINHRQQSIEERRVYSPLPLLAFSLRAHFRWWVPLFVLHDTEPGEGKLALLVVLHLRPRTCASFKESLSSREDLEGRPVCDKPIGALIGPEQIKMLVCFPFRRDGVVNKSVWCRTDRRSENLCTQLKSCPLSKLPLPGRPLSRLLGNVCFFVFRPYCYCLLKWIMLLKQLVATNQLAQFV